MSDPPGGVMSVEPQAQPKVKLSDAYIQHKPNGGESEPVGLSSQ